LGFLLKNSSIRKISIKKLDIKFVYSLFLILCLAYPPEYLQAGSSSGTSNTYLLKGYYRDTIPPPDSLVQLNALSDSSAVITDTVAVGNADTVPRKSSAIDAPVDYSAEDSILSSISGKKVFLYGQAEVKYQDIVLKADYIEFDMTNNSVIATGLPDSTGRINNRPEFTQGNETFLAMRIEYNFDTKKGYIEQIKTEQEGGFLHSEQTKRQANGNIFIKKGKYTTCNLDHPHFYLALSKAKSIPNNKIVSGPAYMVMADVPLPVGIPFGFFPSTRTSKSGVLIPTYGEEQRRGFFLRNGGYYFAINDYLDMRITGDIYSRGTWGVNAATNYRKRYRYSGNFSGTYYLNRDPYPDDPSSFASSRDFSIRWTHRQDAKANPTQSFSANVDFSSTSYDRNHTTDLNNYLNTTKRSSISYSKRWAGSPFNFTSSLNHSQNDQNNSVDLVIPTMALTMNSIKPFERKNATGEKKWYENIQLSYNSSLENRVSYKDTASIEQIFDNMENGFQHRVPLSTNIKFLRFFNLSPSINYRGILNTSYIQKYWEPNFYDADEDTTYATVITDTINNLRYAQALFPSVSLTFNPRVYGMYQFREKSNITAMRHVMSPSASVNLTPDVSSFMPDYYRVVQIDTAGNTRNYSIFENGLYGTPTPQGRSGSVSLSLRNTLEMKVKPKNDTATELQKVKILDNFDFRTNYNIFRDSLKWSDISFSTRTRLFKDKVSLDVQGSFDPYSYVKTESNGRAQFTTIDKAALTDLGIPARLTSARISMSSSFSSQQGKEDVVTDEDDRGKNELDEIEQRYVDFDVPWSVNVSYNFSYTKPYEEATIIQTARFSGDFSLTENWKIGFTSGYDFTNDEITMTSINIMRDLHCWEMRFTWVPFGIRQSYNFQINVKAAVLQDLKYNKRRSWYDNL